jgi:hypothetical protein
MKTHVLVPILFLASCDENPEESWYFFGCPDGQPTQELGSRDPFGQYLEVGPRGCEYCSLGSRFNTPPAWVEAGQPSRGKRGGGGSKPSRRWDKPPAQNRLGHQN